MSDFVCVLATAEVFWMSVLCKVQDCVEVRIRKLLPRTEERSDSGLDWGATKLPKEAPIKTHKDCLDDWTVKNIFTIQHQKLDVLGEMENNHNKVSLLEGMHITHRRSCKSLRLKFGQTLKTVAFYFNICKFDRVKAILAFPKVGLLWWLYWKELIWKVNQLQM